MISVIVPAYNDSSFIERCIESVLSQSYQDFELIVIDDGSTDDTPKILSNYKANSKIKVYYQQNQGSGVARNLGLNASRGDFIVFVDSDDWLEPNALELLYEAEKKTDSDLVIGSSNINEIYKNRVVKYCEKCDYFYSRDLSEVRNKLVNLYYSGIIHGPCAKLYKKSLLETHGISFPSYRRSQDIFFNISYFSKIKSICLISQAVYNIRIIKKQNKRINCSRRNASFMISAENERFEIIKKLGLEFDSTLRAWGYIRSNEEQTLDNQKFVIDVHDAVYAIFLRNSKNAVLFMKNIVEDEYFRNYTSITFKNKNAYYNLFWGYLRKKRYNSIICLMRFKKVLLPIYKAVFRRKK